MFKQLTILITLILFVLLIAGCTEQVADNVGFTEVNIDLVERARYDNDFTEANIPNQWEDYGIGDPFIMRYNGEYYLYSSTKNFQYGYRVWKSLDLINYQYLGEFPLTGRDGTQTAHHTAYAPEVYYWNGDFYMYTSPDGRGHYIYKSLTKQPWGEFRAVTENIGLSIDGSVFIDDDEKMYFLHASDGHIKAYEMNSMESVRTPSQKSLYAPLIRWTEGPSILKYDGVYYLTYTGNHVKSKGYRVDYSYATDAPNSENYKYPANNSLLLDSLSEHHGLGHSSFIMGPNLDSYYIAYHNLDSASGPIRSFNINRLTFSGNRMTVLGPTFKGAMVPMMPDFYVRSDGSSYAEGRDDALLKYGNRILSNKTTKDVFSVEYNFHSIEPNGQFKLLFSVTDNGYYYVTINGKEIGLYHQNTLIESGTLVHDFDFNVVHSVRVSHKNGRIVVKFDNLTKIDTVLEEKLPGGKIGYEGLQPVSIGTTVFSNDAFGTSDNKEAKIVAGDFFATTFLDESKLTGKSGIKKLEEDINDDRLIYSDTTSAYLANKGDYLLYVIDVLESGLYGLEMVHNIENAGSKFSIQIDNNKPMIVEIPKLDFSKNFGDYESSLKFAKQLMAEFELEKGLHTFKIELVEGELETTYFNFFESSPYIPKYSHSLSDYVEQGAQYITLWKIDNEEKAHYSKAGVNNMMLFGSTGMTDYTVKVKIKVDVDAASNASSGIIVRTNNPSIYSGQIDESAEGYLITFNNMQLVMSRINYNSMIVAADARDITLGEYHELKVTCIGNTIKVYFDGEYVFEYTDPYPFSHGLVTLYSISTEAYYKDLEIMKPEE